MFARLATFNSRYWAWILLAWVGLGVGLHQIAPQWDKVTRDGDFAFLPATLPSQCGDKLMANAFPDQASKSSIVLVVARPDGLLNEADLTFAGKIAEEFSPKEGVKSPISNVMSFDDDVLGRKLKSPKRRDTPGQAALVMLQLNSEFMAVGNIPFVESVYKRIDAIRQHRTLFKDYALPNDFKLPSDVELPRDSEFPKGRTLAKGTVIPAGFNLPAGIEVPQGLAVPDDYALAKLPDGLQLAVTGSAALGVDTLRSTEESINNTEVVTMLLVLMILLVVYRAPGLVLIPLIAIGVSFIVAVDFIGLVAQFCATYQLDFKIFKTTQIFIIVVLFGAATDYCLFLIARYREEMENGHPPREALEESIRQTGHALTASAMTTILGLGAMIFAAFGKYRSGGPTIALSLIVALIACLTVAPALLRAFGWVVFWPFGVKVRTPKEILIEEGKSEDTPEGHTMMGRFWIFLANKIVAHPGAILATAFIVLSIPAYQGLSVPITYDMITELNPKRPSVQGTRLLEQYFSIGETGPITILIQQDNDDFNSVEQRSRITNLTQELAVDFKFTDTRGEETHPIQQVRSLTNPLGDPPKMHHSMRDIMVSNNPKCKAQFLSSYGIYSGKVTRIDLVCKYDPFSRDAMLMIGKLEQWLKAKSDDPKSDWKGAEFFYVGTTPSIRDLDEVNRSDTFLVGQLVAISVLAVLVFLLRRPVVSLYLIFTVLFGFFVSLGITKLVFSTIYGSSFQGLDWKLQLFLFVILVAVGEDYNIYLVTRVFEEQRRRGAIDGLREAVIRTGGIITSCGVIMAGTFGSMMCGTLRGMIELGFAMSLGVLLDTFIIRTVLVPSFLVLWAHWTGASKDDPPSSGNKPSSTSESIEQPQFDDEVGRLSMAMAKASGKRAAG